MNSSAGGGMTIKEESETQTEKRAGQLQSVNMVERKLDLKPQVKE